jgi:Predicted membrane protein
MSTQQKTVAGTQINIQELALTAMFIALTYVATAFINIRLPIAANGGLIHLGNVPLFVAAALLGKKSGAAAGAFGMALFDITSGWAAWSPFTFVIVGCIGFVFGKITEKKISFPRLVAAVVAACLIKIVGYYIAEVVIYGNLFSPVSSIPGNVIQITVAGIIAVPVIMSLAKILKK